MSSPLLELDPVIHSRLRLAVMSILVSSQEVEFTFLKESTGSTDGNLSTHLAKLQEAGYVKIRKTFRKKKPCTLVKITEPGREAFRRYLQVLERILPGWD